MTTGVRLGPLRRALRDVLEGQDAVNRNLIPWIGGTPGNLVLELFWLRFHLERLAHRVAEADRHARLALAAAEQDRGQRDLEEAADRNEREWIAGDAA